MWGILGNRFPKNVYPFVGCKLSQNLPTCDQWGCKRKKKDKSGWKKIFSKERFWGSQKIFDMICWFKKSMIQRVQQRFLHKQGKKKLGMWEHCKLNISSFYKFLPTTIDSKCSTEIPSKTRKKTRHTGALQTECKFCLQGPTNSGVSGTLNSVRNIITKLWDTVFRKTKYSSTCSL